MSSGLAKAIASGTTTVRGTYLGKSVAATVSVGVAGQQFVTRTVLEPVSGITFTYQVWIPNGWTSTVQSPIILHMHGFSGSYSQDTSEYTTVGLGEEITRNPTTFPFLGVFILRDSALDPDGIGGAWRLAAMLALNAASAEFNADPTRTYLTGISFGGGMTYAIAYHNPGVFAALVPIAARIYGSTITGITDDTPANALAVMTPSAMNTLPMWLFHSANDPTVAVQNARDIYAAFQAVSAPITYTEYPSHGHNGTWNTAYADAALYTWILAKHL